MANNPSVETAVPFPDCLDPECDACRAARYYGVSWSADKCINARGAELDAVDLLDSLWRPTDDTTIEGDESAFDHLNDLRDGDS